MAHHPILTHVHPSHPPGAQGTQNSKHYFAACTSTVAELAASGAKTTAPCAFIPPTCLLAAAAAMPPQADSDDDQPMDDVPPAYKHYLQAPIRSVTDPAQRAANEEAALCAGDVEVLKRKLAAGAAAYVDQRIR